MSRRRLIRGLVCDKVKQYKPYRAKTHPLCLIRNPSATLATPCTAPRNLEKGAVNTRMRRRTDETPTESNKRPLLDVEHHVLRDGPHNPSGATGRPPSHDVSDSAHQEQARIFVTQKHQVFSAEYR